MDHNAVASLPDVELLAQAQSVAADSRRSTVALILLIAEIDARRAFLAQGHPSLSNYCRDALRLSEGEAANRIATARAARTYPVILELLRSGDINMTTVRLLAPHLTADNHAAVLAESRGLTRPQVEELVARLAPKPAVAPSLRRVAPPPVPAAPQVAALPMTSPPTAPAPPPRPAVTPLSPELYRFTVTMTAATRAAWERARELVQGDDAAVLERLVVAAVPVLERQRRGSTQRPQRTKRPTGKHSRHVPADVKRAVEARDGGRCAFVGRHGQRCTMRRNLQFHHVVAWMAGGPTTVDNVQLRCGPHNRHEARVCFGASRERGDAAPNVFPNNADGHGAGMSAGT